MIYLQAFEAFTSQSSPELSVAVGDLINVNLDGAQVMGKVIKKPSENVYIINVVKDNLFVDEPIKIDSSQVINMAKSIEEPAMNNDMVTQQTTKVSNDMVINNGGGMRI